MNAEKSGCSLKLDLLDTPESKTPVLAGRNSWKPIVGYSIVMPQNGTNRTNRTALNAPWETTVQTKLLTVLRPLTIVEYESGKLDFTASENCRDPRLRIVKCGSCIRAVINNENSMNNE